MIKLSAMSVGDFRVAKNTSETIYNYDLDVTVPTRFYMSVAC